MDENKRKYINEEGSFLRKYASRRLLQLYKKNPDTMQSLASSEIDLCKENGIEFQSDEEASTKAREYMVSQVKELLEAARAVIASKGRKYGDSSDFIERIKVDPSKTAELTEKFNDLLNSKSPQVLFEVLLRVKEDLTIVDPVTLDTHHSPLYLDEEDPIATKSNPDAIQLNENMLYWAEMYKDDGERN